MKGKHKNADEGVFLLTEDAVGSIIKIDFAFMQKKNKKRGVFCNGKERKNGIFCGV